LAIFGCVSEEAERFSYFPLFLSRISLSFVFQNRASVDSVDINGRTPLMFAAASNNADACSALVEAGAALNATDLDGCTALHIAYMYGSSSAIAFLEANGADSDALNNTSKLPFEVAGSFNRFPAMFLSTTKGTR